MAFVKVNKNRRCYFDNTIKITERNGKGTTIRCPIKFENNTCSILVDKENQLIALAPGTDYKLNAANQLSIAAALRQLDIKCGGIYKYHIEGEMLIIDLNKRLDE